MASTSEASSSRRRILDYINDGEELGIEEGPAVTPRSPAPAPARTRLPRFGWARMATRLGRKGGCGKGKEEVTVEKGDEHPAAAVSSSVCEADSERRPSDHGVGLSLVFLLAKTSDEFNKMVKVRGEMETLLKEIKDQVWQSSGSHGGASKACNNNLDSAASSCVTDRNENERGIAHLVVEDQATSSGTDAVSFEKSSESACIARMDVLEEEFHAELELLHVNYGSDVLPPFLPEEQDTEPVDEIGDYREGFNDDSRGAEVVEEEDDDDADQYYGVSAVKLERRLHELLHQRNQERIEELESALRRAEKKLVEKEMEVSLWKDTARLALRQNNKL